MDFITPCLNVPDVPGDGNIIGSNGSGGTIIETPGGIIIVFPDGSQYRYDENGYLVPIG